MRATRARAVATPRHRAWTVDPPQHWRPELCLDDELELLDLAHDTTGALNPGA